MIKIYLFLLNKSYAELKEKKDFSNIKKIILKHKKNNFKINYYVLNRLNISFFPNISDKITGAP